MPSPVSCLHCCSGVRAQKEDKRWVLNHHLFAHITHYPLLPLHLLTQCAAFAALPPSSTHFPCSHFSSPILSNHSFYIHLCCTYSWYSKCPLCNHVFVHELQLSDSLSGLTLEEHCCDSEKTKHCTTFYETFVTSFMRHTAPEHAPGDMTERKAHT